jgi:hypothetical protein
VAPLLLFFAFCQVLRGEAAIVVLIEHKWLTMLFFGARKMFRTLSGARVTGLGEFSPIWRVFALGSFSECKEVAQIFGPLISQYNLYLYCGKKWAGPRFGRFFSANASGHPGSRRRHFILH